MMPHEFNLVRRILKERSGIELGADKMDLVEAKLRPLVKELEFPSFAHFILALMKPDADKLRSRVAQAVAVLESYFYRDRTPFEYFTGVMLPRLMERRGASRRIRIWCAAVSTGQEAYSLAMLLEEAKSQLVGWKVEIVATDFVGDALLRAKNGVYSQFEVQRGLPVSKLVRYFVKVTNGWQIKPELRARVDFREHNLIDNCQELGEFDVIFCRNVLIYFDERLKSAVLSRLAGQLASDGYLVLGAAETTSGLSPDFVPVPEGRHGVFCLAPAVIAARIGRMERTGRLRASGPRAALPSGGQSRVGMGLASLDRPATVAPIRDSKVRAVELDAKTAGLLEARARARGMSVAELLAEFAVTGLPVSEGLPGRSLKAGSS
ncbi:MAG: CheR family methyltransferase [Methyloceanibacter sp.]|uniref:CheR family methyltransferase n=1 Tax=Methyloceanibacter sp. TaxID=1965321 RepID=UPI003D6D04F3